MQYSADWSEEASLGDGTLVLLRFVRPKDAEALREGFEQLSPRSRYLRFHGTRAHLSGPDLEYLTQPDGEDHVAIGARLLDPLGREGRGVGVARFVRLAGQPQAAEAAVTVVDDFQRRGLGKLLMSRLADAARERGIERFDAEVLTSNQSMLHLLEGLGTCAGEAEDGVLHLKVPIAPPVEPAPDPLGAAMNLAAQGVFRILGWPPRGRDGAPRT